ncbi:MAG: YeiH family protein [Planctomycetota bacterium]|jgi:uncharacterized membrane protein YadS
MDEPQPEQSPDEKQEEVITEAPKSRISDLWKTEDYWAIWLGFLILVIGIIIYFPRGPEGLDKTAEKAEAKLAAEIKKAGFKTIEWYKATDSMSGLKATDSDAGKWIKKFTAKPHAWIFNPLHAFYMNPETAKAQNQWAEKEYEVKTKKNAATEALEAAKIDEESAAAAGFKDIDLNKKAGESISTWRTSKGQSKEAGKKVKFKSFLGFPYLIGLMIGIAIFFGIGMKVMGHSFLKFVLGFAFVFFIAVLAYTSASQIHMKELGIGYAAWAILFGLIISNTIGTPKWVMPAVQTEYYIKTGLVLLGAEILFGKILSIGLPGIFVAWVVTPIVLVTTFWFGQKILKISSKTLNITISADMSVCGVSAAIAVAAACRAKKEELTLAVGLSLVFTSIMMILMPMFIKAVGIPHVIGGAWMGGTIDATGAVAAAGAFLSDKALNVAATIKMIQNVLIGVIAFCVAVYWCAKVECVEGQKVSAMEIWYRFPKFVIGFILASIAFSTLFGCLGYCQGHALIDNGVIAGFSKIFRGWFFCLAFVSIGLATNFRELKGYLKGGKPLILYICGQSFNLLLTLTMAYIMFWLVFRNITDNI